MTKLLKYIFLVLITLTTLQGKILFDLQEQYFEHAYTQSSRTGLYQLPHVNVSTVNILQAKDGKYVTEFSSSGTLLVRLNQEREDFRISIKARYKSTYFLRSSSIVLKSEDGEEFIIMFNKNQIVISGKVFHYKDLDKKIFHIGIKKEKEKFTVFIDGKLISEYNMPTFGSLKRIEQSLNNISGISSQDCLYDMVISGK